MGDDGWRWLLVSLLAERRKGYPCKDLSFALIIMQKERIHAHTPFISNTCCKIDAMGALIRFMKEPASPAHSDVVGIALKEKKPKDKKATVVDPFMISLKFGITLEMFT